MADASTDVAGARHRPAVSSRKDGSRCQSAQRCRPCPASIFSEGGGTASTGHAARATQYRLMYPPAIRAAVPRRPAPMTSTSPARYAARTRTGPTWPRTTTGSAATSAGSPPTAAFTVSPRRCRAACSHSRRRYGDGYVRSASSPPGRRPRQDEDQRGVVAPGQRRGEAQRGQVPRRSAHAGDDTADRRHVRPPFPRRSALRRGRDTAPAAPRPAQARPGRQGRMDLHPADGTAAAAAARCRAVSGAAGYTSRRARHRRRPKVPPRARRLRSSVPPLRTGSFWIHCTLGPCQPGEADMVTV
jgi:hypothetical protein